jgi:hypothetical protein
MRDMRFRVDTGRSVGDTGRSGEIQGEKQADRKIRNGKSRRDTRIFMEDTGRFGRDKRKFGKVYSGETQRDTDIRGDTERCAANIE